MFPGKNGSKHNSRIRIDTQLTVRSKRFPPFLSFKSSPRLKSTRSNGVSWGTSIFYVQSLLATIHLQRPDTYLSPRRYLEKKSGSTAFCAGISGSQCTVYYVSDTNIAMKDSAFETQNPQYLQTCGNSYRNKDSNTVPSRRLNNVSDIFLPYGYLSL